MNKHMALVEFGILTAVAILAASMIIYGASVADTHYSSGRSLTANSFSYGVPKGSKLALNINYRVVNDEDSGTVGYWALDDYVKTVQVWLEPDGKTYYAVAKYVGTWNTFAGALSPGSGTNESSDATGSMFGGYAATFTANGVTCKNGNLGTFDLGGTQSDIMLGTYGKGQNGNPNAYSYVSSCFSNAANFNYLGWGWSYNYRGQEWVDTQSGISGDIIS